MTPSYDLHTSQVHVGVTVQYALLINPMVIWSTLLFWANDKNISVHKFMNKAHWIWQVELHPLPAFFALFL